MKNRINERRSGLGWSQQYLANELGVSRQTIISIEKGRYAPSLPLAFRFAELFECTIEEIFEPEENEK